MRTDYSIKNSITSFVGNIITFTFAFVGQILFIRILGVEYNGLNGLFNNVLTILNLFELGIGTSITYNLYKYVKNNNKEIIKSIMQFYKKSYYYIALIVFIVGLLLMPFLSYIVKVTVNINLYVIYLLFLINTASVYFVSYKRNLLVASQKNYIINIVNIGYVVILNIVQILILYLTKNYYIYLIIKIICAILENIIISIIVNKMYPYMLEKNIKPLNKNIKKNITNRVKALIIHKTSATVTNGTDNILISIFLGITTVGIYTNYNYIISAIKKLFSNIISNLIPSIGNLLVEDNKEKNYQTFKKIKFLNIWITTFTSTCLLLLIEPVIELFIGKSYILDKAVLIVLIINYFQTMMRNNFATFKDAGGIWVEDKYVPLIQLSINLISSIILLKLMGLKGVFVGTILSSLVLWFYSYPKFVYKKLFNKKIVDYYKEMFTTLIICFSIIIFVYITANIYKFNSLLSELIITTLICVLLPNLLLYMVFRKTNEYNYYRNLIRQKIKQYKSERRKSNYH